MGYRNIKPRLIHIDELLSICGLFHSPDEGEGWINGGHACKSKSKHKQMFGECFSCACPLAWEADLEDFKEHDQHLYEEYKDETYEPADVGAGWVVQYRESTNTRFPASEDIHEEQ